MILTGVLLYKNYGWQGPAARAARRFGRAAGPGELDRCPSVSKNSGSAMKYCSIGSHDIVPVAVETEMKI
ncbi:hypothetical protein ACFL02_02920 [Planctomycetota bacterium]